METIPAFLCMHAYVCIVKYLLLPIPPFLAPHEQLAVQPRFLAVRNLSFSSHEFPISGSFSRERSQT